MPLVEGGYDEWAKAGKPSSGALQATTDTFDKIAAKSTKKSKTTGKSPRDTAIESITDKTLKTIVKNANAAAEQKSKLANEAVDKAAKDAAKRKEVSDKAYSDQAGQIKALNDAWPSRILPKEFDPVLPPLDIGEVGTTNLKEKSSAPPSAATVPVVPTDKTTPVLSPEISAAAQAEYQRTGQMPAMTTDKVQKLQAQIDTSKSKLAAAQTAMGKKHRSFWGDLVNDPFNLGNVVNAAANVLSPVAEGAATGLEYLDNYTAQPVNTFIKDMGNPDKSMSEVWHDVVGATQGHVKTSSMDIINANRSPLITEDPNQPHHFVQFDPATNSYTPTKDIPWYLRVPAQAAQDILFNPTTYVGLNTIAEGGRGIMAGAAAKDAVDVNNEIIKSAAKYAAGKGVTAKAATAGKNISKEMVKAGGPIGNTGLAHEQLANDLLQKALAGGMKLPDAIANVRVAVEREVAADAAKAKMATLAVNAAKNNRRIVNLKVAGKDIPLGKVPFVDIPYQGARAAKAAVAKTDIGQGLSKMFSTNYWFPGETKTLWNKANSMGVASFHDTQNEINNVFKGLTKADTIRIADETHLGTDLSGQLSKKGIDLGPAQKYFQALTEKHFGEDVLRGKYTATDKVGGYVYHHYLKGSPEKIRDIKKTRKAKLAAGEKFTLQEADDLGLKPLREADKILLAHTAEHQRAMINDAFNRSMVARYGHVMDNPIAADKLGLESVKPPKNMKMKPGHALYMDREVKKVYQNVSKFMGKTDEETYRFFRVFDKLMRGWKIGNTSLRPAHHVRNAIGDTFMNYLDGLQNPYRYEQGLKMTTGGRAGLKVRMGNMLLSGDDIERLSRASGMNKGFISSEFMEGKNPIMKHIQSFSEKREMAGRYAHFIDVLVKEGKKANLGANNTAGMYKIATEAGKRVNKWNINYADLTPFERNVMKRVMPFYTWMRKATPLLMESMATRPGRIQGATQLNNTISNFFGVDPTERGQIDYPQWLKDTGFARISDIGQAEPNVFSVPLPTQDLGRMFGEGTPHGFAQEILNNLNPILQTGIELGTGRNLYTGGQLDPNELQYAGHKIGVIQNILDASGVTGKPTADRINAALGIGTRQVTEASQLSELRRQQDPLQAQVSQMNKELGDYEVHKLKYGYSVYNKATKKAERTGFNSPEEALVYAIGLSNKAKGK